MNTRRLTPVLLAGTLLILTSTALRAETPPAERILPDDTMAMLTVPEWQELCAIQGRSPQWQLWKDPLLKAFREHFEAKWKKEVADPIESELDIRFQDYQGLVQGQLTMALILNQGDEDSEPEPGFVFLIDSKDHREQLSTNLNALRRQWLDKGKSIRTESVQGVEFSVIEISTNDLPNTLRKFMPGRSDVQELADEEGERAETRERRELFIGQSGSLLVMVDSLATAQKIMTRLTGGSLPALAEVEQFSRDQGRLFRNAHSYGWMNAKVLLDLVQQKLAQQEKNRQENAPDPLAQVKPDKVLAATGLSGLHSAAFAYTETPLGSEVTLFLGVPESERVGLFKILTGEPKDTLPPPFVPADVMQYQRWRLDGQKAYATLEQMLREISPQMLNGWNFMVETASTAAQEKDPTFNLREQLMGNLGDDLITYKKAPRGSTAKDLETPPTLFLLGAKNGEQFVSALKTVLAMFLRGNPPATREFLGTTIHTFDLPNPAMTADATARKINVAVSRGYVAFTADEPILEEFLRSADSPVPPLRQAPGLAASTEAVTGPGTSLLSFEDQKAGMRLQVALFQQWATNSTPEVEDPMTPIPESMGLGLPRKGLKEWFNFSLLPPFEKIQHYFYHTVYAGGGSVDGLTLKIFSPTPPQLRGGNGGSEPESEGAAEAKPKAAGD
ncbi:MAG: hypothetical protein MUE94_05430 [Verrucomicrobia bacterium]|jgi:hypothetical protein|nr:hypothetical protein [Verrucomicrobiota bacterium]